MILTLSLLAALAAADPPRAPDPPARVAASFIVHRQPAIPLVALRMAILADDPEGYAGAGHLMQHLLVAGLREQAARVGGLVQAERSADALVYTVTGPAAELRYLAGAMRGVLQAPRVSEGELLGANRALAEERLAEWETADRHVRAALRTRLFPNDLSAAGTESSAARLTLNALPALWAQMYRPERVVVVAVGDVSLGELEEAFSDLPARPAARPLEEARDTASLRPLAPAQATRGWLAAGYPANDLDPGAVSVAARLVRDDLRRRLPTVEVTAEHWWTHHGQALVLVLSAPPAQIANARRALSTAVSTVGREVTERQVRDAALAIRREMLFYARTPDRMAEVLGSFADRDGAPDGAQSFYGALEGVETAEVKAALEALLARTPERVELAPQVLNTAPRPRS